jgi:hypothetical protein
MLLSIGSDRSIKIQIIQSNSTIPTSHNMSRIVSRDLDNSLISSLIAVKHET